MIDLDHLRVVGRLLDHGSQVSDRSGVVTQAAAEIERLQEVIRALLAERDALIHDNSEYVSAANEFATENQRLREALTEMVDVAERVDGWASFPQEAMDRARAALAQGTS